MNNMEQGVVFIGDSLFESYLAISPEEQMNGLMHVAAPVPNMAFLYARPQVNKFWMKSTPSPLDIIFCNGGKVSEICYGEPYSLSMIGGNKLSDLVIELPYGTVEDERIVVGKSVGLAKPTPEELRKILASKYCGNFAKF
jgi:uncharacterized membrane protein (UPF0127 family)